MDIKLRQRPLAGLLEHLEGKLMLDPAGAIDIAATNERLILGGMRLQDYPV